MFEDPNDRWIATFTGKRFFATAFENDINIFDIAVALSKICRFTGHCNSFYSVAQHSVLVSYEVPKEYALWALFHDGAEAYIGDKASPIKPEFPYFKILEKQILQQIAKKFHLNGLEIPQIVKEADLRMLATEKKFFMDNQNYINGLSYSFENFLKIHDLGHMYKKYLPNGFESHTWKSLEGIEPYDYLYMTPWGSIESMVKFLKRFEELYDN